MDDRHRRTGNRQGYIATRLLIESPYFNASSCDPETVRTDRYRIDEAGSDDVAVFEDMYFVAKQLLPGHFPHPQDRLVAFGAPSSSLTGLFLSTTNVCFRLGGLQRSLPDSVDDDTQTVPEQGGLDHDRRKQSDDVFVNAVRQRQHSVRVAIG